MVKIFLELFVDYLVNLDVLESSVDQHERLEVGRPVISLVHMPLEHHFECTIDRDYVGMVAIQAL